MGKRERPLQVTREGKMADHVLDNLHGGSLYMKN